MKYLNDRETELKKLILLKKIVKYESKLSNLEAENKKLKKELIIQKRKKRDNRTVRIRQ